MQGVFVNSWNYRHLTTLSIRQDVFKIRLDKIKKRQEKNKISLDVFTLLVSSVCETWFIDQRSLFCWHTRLASLVCKACSINQRKLLHHEFSPSSTTHAIRPIFHENKRYISPLISSISDKKSYHFLNIQPFISTFAYFIIQHFLLCWLSKWTY